MVTSRRTTIWLVLAALSIAGAAWMATGATALGANAQAWHGNVTVNVGWQPCHDGDTDVNITLENPRADWNGDENVATARIVVYRPDGGAWGNGAELLEGETLALNVNVPAADYTYKTTLAWFEIPHEAGDVMVDSWIDEGAFTVPVCEDEEVVEADVDVTVGACAYGEPVDPRLPDGIGRYVTAVVTNSVNSPADAWMSVNSNWLGFSGLVRLYPGESATLEGVLTDSGYTLVVSVQWHRGLEFWGDKQFRYDLDIPECEEATTTTVPPNEFKIDKEQVGGPLDTLFTFSVQCDQGTPFEVEVYGNEMSDIIETQSDGCTVTEIDASSPNGLSDWTTNPVSRQLTLDPNPEVVTLFEFTNTYIEQPKLSEIRIVKDQFNGPVDTLFDFTIECAMGDGGPVGTEAPVQVYGGDMSGIIEIEAEYDRCTVTEVFDNGDGDNWMTTVNQAGIPGRSLTLELNPEGLTTFLFQNTWIKPKPKDATVTVTKEFAGPEAWEFGFAFVCEGFGSADTFTLGGGESQLIKIPFYATDVLLSEDIGDENGDMPAFLCGVAEQQLVGDWEVNISVSGAYESYVEPTDDLGGLVVFLVHPGDEIKVTFENLAGYAAQKPSGIPPTLETNKPA